MDIPSLFMIPSAVSSGKVHSVFPNSTDADFQFNRDSDATRVNSEGLIERVGYYGSELVTNGDFSVDAHWTQGSNISISNGKLVFANANRNTDFAQQSITAPTGVTYKITFTVSDLKNGDSIKVRYPFQDTSVDSNGTHTLFAVGTTANFIRFTPNSLTGTFKLDNVSVKQVTGDRARLNYEIEGGLVNTKPSLLLEPQSTNLVTYSEDFSNWSTINATSTSNYSISPSGELNASRFLTSGESNSYLYVTGISTTASQQYTVSFYVKSNKNGLDDFKIYTSLAGGDSVVFTATENWQRFDHTVTATSTSIFVGLRGVSGKETDVLVYGAQFEQLSYPTSLIITNGSVQTRTSETCNGAGTSSILPSEEGILYAEVSTNADSNFKRISIHSGSYVNSVFFDFDNTNNLYGKVIVGGSAVVTIIASGLNIENNNKIALSYKENDFKLFVNGSKVGTDVTGSTPTGLNNLSFDLAGGQDFYGKIRDIRVYNTKEMTDSEVDILLTKITS